jgi:hypothetical protein
MSARLACAAMLLAACEGASGTDMAVDLAGPIDLEPPADLYARFDLLSSDLSPIHAPSNTWTWVDVGGSVCDDGSQTGIGVNRQADDKLLIYFEGGGACGDYASCYQANTAAHGPFGAPELVLVAPSLSLSGVLDRSAARNPFADYSLVYIPYCTGDLHAGDQIVTYSLLSDVRMYHHVGHTNALLALDRIVATWPNLKKLVVSGISAGGYGASANYIQFRARWPGASAYLVDDSGPLLRMSDTSMLLETWFEKWGVYDWLGDVCPACNTDISQLYPTLSATFPADRMALLSSLNDAVISGFYSKSSDVFQAELLALATMVIDPLPRFARFFVDGTSHTMLPVPEAFSTKGVDLWTWLTRMVSDDPAWATVAP